MMLAELVLKNFHKKYQWGRDSILSASSYPMVPFSETEQRIRVKYKMLIMIQ